MLRGKGKQQATTQSTESTTTTNSKIIQQLTNKIDKIAETVAQQGEQISTLLALIQQIVK